MPVYIPALPNAELLTSPPPGSGRGSPASQRRPAPCRASRCTPLSRPPATGLTNIRRGGATAAQPRQPPSRLGLRENSLRAALTAEGSAPESGREEGTSLAATPSSALSRPRGGLHNREHTPLPQPPQPRKLPDAASFHLPSGPRHPPPPFTANSWGLETARG
ncbi:uncharacterized protein LOC132648385 isoform X2 [Meriones unguiculatus]|nr:uncharacterized protein LOC132648385 isoform X2 [Meriones unguiculatus]